MQNKPNFPNAQMNVNAVKTMNYEQLTMNNEPIKQTQFIPTEGGTNPISKQIGRCRRVGVCSAFSLFIWRFGFVLRFRVAWGGFRP